MLLIAALLLACGGPAELSQPSDPPDPWPMSKAVISATAGGQPQTEAPSTEEPAPEEGAVETETPPAEAPPEAPPEAAPDPE